VKRGQLVTVGSDTHGWDWDMAVYRFDVQSREWLRSGTAEPRYTYRTDRLGRRVAGSASRVPWAMHAYNQLTIDPKQDMLWLVSAPMHNHVPTVGPACDVPWMFDLGRALWHSQRCDGTVPVFFSAVTVYDPSRNTLVASAALQAPAAAIGLGAEREMQRGGVWELGPARQRWQPVSAVSPHGADVSGVFDEAERALLVFERRDKFFVHRYVPSTVPGANGTWSTTAMPDGNCAHRVEYPPVPSVYVGYLGRTLLLPEGADGRRRTCLYDARLHSLTDLGIDPPPGISMNFTLAYDPALHVVLIVTGAPQSDRKARVWALRLRGVRE
jgi:hypothetical protein